MNAIIASSASALKSGELRVRVARSLFCRAQVLVCGQLQIETLLCLFELLARSFGCVLGLLKLHLRPGAELNLDQWIVLSHELAGRDQNVPHARFKSDRNGVGLAWLRDYASVNNHFLGDGF